MAKTKSAPSTTKKLAADVSKDKKKSPKASPKPGHEETPTLPRATHSGGLVPKTPRAAKGQAAKPVATKPLQAQDPRLPAPGTVLEKRDRHGAVRRQRKVEEDGIHYAGTTYRSISSAALAAAKDLGLKNKTQNGFVFWGLSKPTGGKVDFLAGVEAAWERYIAKVKALGKEEEPNPVPP